MANWLSAAPSEELQERHRDHEYSAPLKRESESPLRQMATHKADESPVESLALTKSHPKFARSRHWRPSFANVSSTCWK